MRRITLALGVMLALLLFGAAMLGTAQSATTPKYGKCKPTGKYNSLKLKTVKPGVLTVGYNTISPRTYKGNTPDTVNDGFNYCFAANLAWRAGIPKMKLHLIDFAQLIVGRLSGYDVAIDDFYIKPEREEKVDFSIPYGHSWTGLVARTDGPAPTKAGMKDMKFAVSLGSVQQTVARRGAQALTAVQHLRRHRPAVRRAQGEAGRRRPHRPAGGASGRHGLEGRLQGVRPGESRRPGRHRHDPALAKPEGNQHDGARRCSRTARSRTLRRSTTSPPSAASTRTSCRSGGSSVGWKPRRRCGRRMPRLRGASGDWRPHHAPVCSRRSAVARRRRGRRRVLDLPARGGPRARDAERLADRRDDRRHGLRRARHPAADPGHPRGRPLAPGPRLELERRHRRGTARCRAGPRERPADPRVRGLGGRRARGGHVPPDEQRRVRRDVPLLGADPPERQRHHPCVLAEPLDRARQRGADPRRRAEPRPRPRCARAGDGAAPLPRDRLHRRLPRDPADHPPLPRRVRDPDRGDPRAERPADAVAGRDRSDGDDERLRRRGLPLRDRDGALEPDRGREVARLLDDADLVLRRGAAGVPARPAAASQLLHRPAEGHRARARRRRDRRVRDGEDLRRQLLQPLVGHLRRDRVHPRDDPADALRGLPDRRQARKTGVRAL